MRQITIALAGNPNCGKTTIFNYLTGSSQYVGNWPGVTVEKKEGRLRGHKEVVIQDLPGIYSLSPYTPEEVVARSFLVRERPDAILNIVDGTNIERNLYLTTQLIELGIPVVVAVNMMDLVRKNGDRLDLAGLGRELGCTVVETSALKGEGCIEAAETATRLAQSKTAGTPPQVFTGGLAQALARIEEAIAPLTEPQNRRWYAAKLFERDQRAAEELPLDQGLRDRIEEWIGSCEAALEDDAESIITSQRYAYITRATAGCVQRKASGHSLTVSDRIDRIVTHRVLALPIFVAVMLLVYATAMGGWGISVGTAATDWANDGLFGEGWFLSGGDGYQEAAGAFEEASAIVQRFEEAAAEAGLTTGDAAARGLTAEVYFYDDESGETTLQTIGGAEYTQALSVEEPDPNAYGRWVNSIPAAVRSWLEAVGCAPLLTSLIVEGMIGGVGSVLGFVPQMLVLFLLLSILEDVGYMARVAFLMDRIFRRFGLSGKSFIPMLVGTGCGVPGIMASRTIENERDRRMTIMTTCFIPCGAKMPIIALFAGALFGGSAWVAASAYFAGIGAIVVSGIMLKKTRFFAGEAAPFVMELPAYHLPAPGNVLRATFERGWSFVRRAGTVILASSIVLWFLQGFGFSGGALVPVTDNDASLLAGLGSVMAPVFAPLGFGSWQAAVAVVTGLIAKEEVVSTLRVLYPGDPSAQIALAFTGLSGYSFLLFNLLCAPCFAAMGAIRREMNHPGWTAAAIGYMCAFAYGTSLVVYRVGGLLTGEVAFGLGSVAALVVAGGVLWLLVRRGYCGTGYRQGSALAVKAGG